MLAKRLGIVAACLVIGGCGFKSGYINDPPPPTATAAPVDVTVYRDRSVIGSPVPMTFLIDGREIYGLWIGQSHTFRLEPGDYAFGYYLALNTCRHLVTIAPGAHNRIKLAPNCVIENETADGPGYIVQSYDINLVNDEFAFNSAQLKPEMKVALDDLARRVRASPGQESLTIVGHTDSIGNPEYNYGLGLRRAQATKSYLVRSGGLDARRIRVASAGESEPVASNSSEQGRAINRRIEIKAAQYSRSG
jgi:outer membrane protein OmpA-like peptidoglycan-associated protein